MVQAAFDNSGHSLAGEPLDHVQSGVNPVARGRA
jgi:hypothetical protein